MKLVWKLLRHHISIGQFIGFFFANLFGMFIVMLAFQFYHDVLPVFTAQDSFMSADYLILSKKIGAMGRSHDFDQLETEEIANQPFTRKVGRFTSAEYRIEANMGVNGKTVLRSELPIESVPDGFIDVPLEEWSYQDNSHEVPIILPRVYITMYNFGFAHSHSLPKINDGLVGMIDFHIFVHGNSLSEEFKGRVIGFSSRINSILVPQAFMDWSNQRFAPNEKSNPSRLILEVKNPADERITQFVDSKGYEVEDDKLNAEKTTYFLKMIVSMVMVVGLIISMLSFYILMLSIFLLVQKNAEKLENLLLIGYSPRRVSRPYQLLTGVLNVSVLLLALVILYFVRKYYMGVIITLFPQIEEQSLWPAICVGLFRLLLVTCLNVVAIRQKVMNIWKGHR